MTLISGWGRYPKVESEIIRPDSVEALKALVVNDAPMIARGLGRSYGDSSLASMVIESTRLNRLTSFDQATGILKCDAGVSLDEVLNVFVSRGWFLPVTPGSCFVTLGGAVASDVHGKNHHLVGSFCDHVTELEVALGNGDIVTISPQNHPDLFFATCGGMGLTGIILSVSLRLIKIQSSSMIQRTIRAPDLNAILQLFDENLNAPYSVAWIDCLAKGRHMGRSLLMLGEHAQDHCYDVAKAKVKNMTFDMPEWLLNKYSITAFNQLYYLKSFLNPSITTLPYRPFFYPLDAMTNWNRLYGKNGFLQYQFVLPKTSGREAILKILKRISESGRGSFLAVLKAFGRGNQNLLSFPIEGYTLALDFKLDSEVFNLLNELDAMVADYDGRIYLSKDARMSEQLFKRTYPLWREFEDVRAKYHALGKFSSTQSIRLGLQ